MSISHSASVALNRLLSGWFISNDNYSDKYVEIMKITNDRNAQSVHIDSINMTILNELIREGIVVRKDGSFTLCREASSRIIL